MQLTADEFQQLRARVHQIIKWLLRHQHDVAGPSNVQVTFHCGGNQLVIEVKSRQTVKGDTGPLTITTK